MILKCIAIDDEPPGLAIITTFIGQTPFLNLVSSFSNAIEALRYLQDHRVDLIFLDMQMPELSGIELARILVNQSPLPSTRIIFTTAFDKFALEGYKLNILDYLLKPYSFEDFYRAASKALKLAEQPNYIGQNHINRIGEEGYLYLKVEFQTIKVACSSILFIEGLKDYAKVHLDGNRRPLLSLITLKALEEKLSKAQFMRIHKSFIVNLDKISAVARNSVQIEDKVIPVTGQYKEPFAHFLKAWN